MVGILTTLASIFSSFLLLPILCSFTALHLDKYEGNDSSIKLVGDVSGAYSRRINIQHQLVYQVLEAQKEVKILRLWTHYE